jgi:class 3 adenylate cyclase
MKWFESLVTYLFPHLLIEQEEWQREWEAGERSSFVTVARIFFPFVALGYVLHYYLFDRPMGLEPIENWFNFRMTTAGLLMACFAFYCSRLATTSFYKAPAVLICASLCVSQAYVAKWYGLEAWVFCFFFVLAGVLMIRTTPLRSLLFAMAVILIQTPILLDAQVALSNIASGAIVTVMLTLAVRTSYISDVKHFLLNQKHVEDQKQINELSIEFSNRIASFIPKVIADRLNTYVNRDRMSVLEASVEALKARRCDIACLFTDIRGYTEGSKNLDSFVNESVLPEVKLCADAVESHSGIPRKIGDLIFAYFDAPSVHLNLIRAVISGIEIARINAAMNATGTQMPIKRYILISSGDAMVGNFGGLDSSVEITALGSPVNFLSRLDDITKAKGIAELLDPGDLILCKRSVELLQETNLDLRFQEINLKDLGLTIRDFPETTIIYTLKPNDAHYADLLEQYTLIEENDRVAGEGTANGFAR